MFVILEISPYKWQKDAASQVSLRIKLDDAIEEKHETEPAPAEPEVTQPPEPERLPTQVSEPAAEKPEVKAEESKSGREASFRHREEPKAFCGIGNQKAVKASFMTIGC